MDHQPASPSHSHRPGSVDSRSDSESPSTRRASPPFKTEQDDDRHSYASSERGSPRPAEEDASPKPQTNPPNVTIIQPSVNHPMLSYLYQTGLYSTPHPMSFPISPMMFSGGAMAAAAAAAAAHGSSLPGMPFLPASLAGSDLSGHFPSGAGLTGGSGMMLTNPLAMAGHSLWQQTYAAALSGHSNAFEPPSTTIPSAFGPLFASRSLNSSHRFAPYGFPFTKSTSSSSSPLAGHGLRSPIVDLSRPVSPTSPLGRRCSMPSPAHSSPGSMSSRSSGAPSSELKNIERMVSGLERRHERLGAVSDK